MTRTLGRLSRGGAGSAATELRGGEDLFAARSTRAAWAGVPAREQGMRAAARCDRRGHWERARRAAGQASCALALLAGLLAACWPASGSAPLTPDERRRLIREHVSLEQLREDGSWGDSACTSTPDAVRLQARMSQHRGADGFDARVCPKQD